jgi:hypothetical protein
MASTPGCTWEVMHLIQQREEGRDKPLILVIQHKLPLRVSSWEAREGHGTHVCAAAARVVGKRVSVIRRLPGRRHLSCGWSRWCKMKMQYVRRYELSDEVMKV